MSTIEGRLRELVARKFGAQADTIVKDTHFRRDLGADSLDAVDLILMIEDEFRIDIPDEDASHIATFQDAVHLLSMMVEDAPLTA